MNLYCCSIEYKGNVNYMRVYSALVERFDSADIAKQTALLLNKNEQNKYYFVANNLSEYNE